MEKLIYLFWGISALIIVIAFTLSLIKREKLLFLIPFVITFIPIEYIDRYFFKLPTILNWLPQLILLLCGIVSAIVLIKRPMKSSIWFSIAYFLFIFLAIISISINGNNIVSAIYSQRGFIFIFSFLVASKAMYDRLSLDKFYKLTIKAGFISALLAVFQRMLVTLTSSTGDMVTGLFSSDSQYLYFHCICFIITIAYWYNGQQLMRKISASNLSILFILSIGIANNKAGIGFLILILLFFAIYVGYRNFWKFFGRLIILGIFISVSLLIFEKILIGSGRLKNEESSFAYLSDPEYVSDYMFGSDDNWHGQFSKSGTLRRGAAITFGYTLLSKDPYHFLFGRGPGSTSESSIGEGDLSKVYEGYKIGRSTLSEKLTEHGLLGTIFFIGVLLAVYFANSKEHPLNANHLLIKKVAILFMLVYLPYENIFLTIINGLVFTLLLYPNITFIEGETLFSYLDDEKINQADLNKINI
ncbi:hypothetical protein [Chondrinema litorale]|uniref:hypothetical protein n=1 Tax=Chondrinema litorale TaxID=2994555 RepID=UPI00254352FA|nr:hypothetical protein [Chondrinema litorale]UZS00184.1 hypothetical protein OQ292_40215 [Chondrinema litorale]